MKMTEILANKTKFVLDLLFYFLPSAGIAFRFPFFCSVERQSCHWNNWVKLFFRITFAFEFAYHPFHPVNFLENRCPWIFLYSWRMADWLGYLSNNVQYFVQPLSFQGFSRTWQFFCFLPCLFVKGYQPKGCTWWNSSIFGALGNGVNKFLKL